MGRFVGAARYASPEERSIIDDTAAALPGEPPVAVPQWIEKICWGRKEFHDNTFFVRNRMSDVYMFLYAMQDLVISTWLRLRLVEKRRPDSCVDRPDRMP